MALLGLNALQAGLVLLLSPGLKGFVTWLEHRISGRRGPSILQPYFDLAKLLRKERLMPEGASWIFRVAPLLVFASPLVVALLIPVLTTFPLTWAFVGDMVAGGFILGLGGFFLQLAALDSASPYAAIGSSRSRFVAFLAEPVMILVFFAVTYVAHATIPYVVNQRLWQAPLLLSPTHVLLAAALFLVILAEGGRIPIDNPSSHHELSQIEESRLFEYSGPDLALIEWGGMSKTMILVVILMNVLISPLGLASGMQAGPVALAVLALLLKMLLFGILLAAVESSFAKLRLLRAAEFLAGAFAISLLALISFTLGG